MVLSKCGMRCDLCLVYRPNVEKEDRRAEAEDRCRTSVDLGGK